MDVMREFVSRIARTAYDRFAPAGRSVRVRDDYVFLTSYPKSGNTWMRFIVSNLKHPDSETNLENVLTRIPDIYDFPNHFLESVPSPKVLKSHEQYDHRYPRTIYVVRDPRACSLSYYHYLLRKGLISEDVPVDDYIDGFLEGRYSRFGTWRDHVRSWLLMKSEDPDFMMVRYEDLTESPYKPVEEVDRFLEFGSDRNILEQAIENSSFSNLQEKEARAGQDWSGADVERPETRFFRKGDPDEWKQRLSEQSIRKIEDATEDAMALAGYDRFT